jgi:hypothetical protein
MVFKRTDRIRSNNSGTFREGFLVAMTGTIRHEAARRSLLFDRRLLVREPAGAAPLT